MLIKYITFQSLIVIRLTQITLHLCAAMMIRSLEKYENLSHKLFKDAATLKQKFVKIN